MKKKTIIGNPKISDQQEFLTNLSLGEHYCFLHLPSTYRISLFYKLSPFLAEDSLHLIGQTLFS